LIYFNQVISSRDVIVDVVCKTLNFVCHRRQIIWDTTDGTHGWRRHKMQRTT